MVWFRRTTSENCTERKGQAPMCQNQNWYKADLSLRDIMAKVIKVYVDKRVIAEYTASDSILAAEIVENEISRKKNLRITKITIGGKVVWKV